MTDEPQKASSASGGPVAAPSSAPTSGAATPIHHANSICPFIVAEAGDWRLAAPSREHRCTAFNPPTALAPEKQERLCLTASHPTCATYIASVAARQARLSGRRVAPTRWNLARTTATIEDPGGVTAVLLGLVLDRRRWPAIPAVILVTTLLTLAISGFRGVAPADVIGTSSPATLPPTTALATLVPTAEPGHTPGPGATPFPTAGPSAPGPSPQPSFRSYTVKSGDTLSVIASRFGVTVRAIRELNDIADPSTLRVGRVLLIPW